MTSFVENQMQLRARMHQFLIDMCPELGPAFEPPPVLWVYHNGDVCDAPKVYDVMTREGESVSPLSGHACPTS
jgi:hypothetical protein